jgi:hypothetical protein
MPTAARLLTVPLACALLGACGGGKGDNQSDITALDSKLTNSADNGALGNRIVVDPAKVRGGTALAAGDCIKQVRYGNDWAKRMPEPFTLYPGATLTEAAGTSENGCTLKVISFTTTAPAQAVVDHYAGLARAAGYDAGQELANGEIQLGGTRARDDAAYVVFAARRPDGRTSVDIVTGGGR